MRRVLFALLMLSLFPAVKAALPGDAVRGKQLHDAHCVECHDTGVYTRQDRRIQSLASLREQLGACSHAAQVILTDDEQQNIVKYLNQEFYEFR